MTTFGAGHAGGRLKPANKSAKQQRNKAASTPSASASKHSRRPATASGHRSASRGSPPRQSGANNTIQDNDAVAAYVNNCSLLNVEPLLEYVMALSDPTTEGCSLGNHKKGLVENDIICLFNSLRENKSLRSLDLSGNNLTGSLMKEVATGFTGSMTLNNLNLNKNNLHDDGASHLANILRQNFGLLELDIGDNGIGNNGLVALSQALVSNTQLLSLNLQRNQIGDEGAKAFARSAERNRSLQSINFRFNNIGNTGAAAIGEALRFNYGLTELDLGGNAIGAAGCEGLATGLEVSKTLTKLNLRSNAVGDRGAVAIGKALTANTSLVALYLGSNDIGPEGCAVIASSWKQNNTLETVDLQGAVMGRSGAAAVADGIRTNHSLRELILEIEKGDRSSAQELANALRSNTTLTEIFLGDTGAMDPDIAESFANTLRINKFISGVSNKEDHPGSPTPTVDAVVIAMNERLKGMQQELSARDEAVGLSSSPQNTQIVTQSPHQSPISRTQAPTYSSGTDTAPTPEKSLMQKVTAMIDQRLSSGSQSGEVQFGTIEVRRLQERLQEQSHKIEELSAAVATASNKADDAEVTLETVVQEMDSMRPSQGNQLSFSGQRQLESNLLNAVDERMGKLRMELGQHAGFENLSRDGIEGITEALQQHWEQQFAGLERKFTTELQAEQHQREVLANQQDQFRRWTEERLDLLESRVSRLEEQSPGNQDVSTALDTAVAQVRQEARWAQDEAIRIRVEEERRQLEDLQQLRQDVNDQIEALASKLNERGGSHTGLKALEQELKAAHQASLRALESKGRQDFNMLEQKTGEIMERMNVLEVTMRNEQEASLMALEAILGGRST